jgi:hypothetical protein
MQWTLNTGKYGAQGVDAKDLRKVLEESMAHHAKTAPEGVEIEIMGRANTEKGQTKHVAEMAKAATEARTKFEKKLPIIQEQMKAAIDAACDLGDAMTGKVNCSITGHITGSRADKIFKRVSVNVDQAPPTLAGFEDD